MQVTMAALMTELEYLFLILGQGVTTGFYTVPLPAVYG
jgi:hypothetical protein